MGAITPSASLPLVDMNKLSGESWPVRYRLSTLQWLKAPPGKAGLFEFMETWITSRIHVNDVSLGETIRQIQNSSKFGGIFQN